MRRSISKLLFFLVCVSSLAFAQNVWSTHPGVSDGGSVSLPLANLGDTSAGSNANRELSVTIPPTLPRMGPDLALQVYRNRSERQSEQLSSYSATTIIRAELPDTKQSGEYEFQRQYSAPRSLAFKAVRFDGDNFVKNNVILRVLQSEVSHAEKDDPATDAISPINYKFSYKGVSQLDGHTVHVYHIRPRHKRAGLFKGKIYLDSYSGSIVRAEGKPVKSPSLFIKKVDFVQDYADFDSFTFPTHMHSEAQARIVGRAIVDIYESDYHPVSAVTQAQTF
jgi:hypothetical protein